MNKFCITHFVVKSFLLLPNLNFHRYVKWEKALYKVRKSEKITFQWSKVSRLLTTITSHRPDFNTGLRFSFRAPEVPVLRVRKSPVHCFSSLQKRRFGCPKRKSETCSERTQFVRAVNYLLLLQKWQVNISIPGAWTRAGSVRCDFRSLRNQQWIGKLWTPTLTNGNNIWIFFFDIFAQRKPQYISKT